MIGSFEVSALGVRVRVGSLQGLDPEQEDQLLGSWSGALVEGPGEADVEVRFGDGGFDSCMERLTVDVTLAALAALRGKALMFHAAGVAAEDGRTLAFVGPSGRGKTTLSRALGRYFGYVSDETVAVDPQLRVHPHRKPLSVVRPDRPKAQVSPASAGLLELPGVPLRLAALVLLNRDADLARASIADVPLAEALPELVSQMSYLRDETAPLQAVARLCDELGGVRRLSYPDAETVAPLIPELLEHRAEPTPWHPIALRGSAGPYDASHLRDAIDIDGTVLVMTEAEASVLGGIAPVVWSSAKAGRDVDGIVDDVTETFGHPPQGDPREIVEGVIAELVAADILRVR